MISYPSIENLYVRDEQTHKLVVGDFKRPDFMAVDRWHVTEKIDGMNIRLILTWDNGYPHVDIRGRTDKANLPGDFAASAFGDGKTWSQDQLANDLAMALANVLGGDGEGLGDLSMVVFGEGYGPGIQKGGGDYAERKSFRAFDVATFRRLGVNADINEDGLGATATLWSKPLWRTWEDVETVAAALGVETAPVLGTGIPTREVEAWVRGFESVVAAEDKGMPKLPEGVILRTDPYLYDFRGSRVILKLKGHDLL